jgi:hypothetical protein
MSLNYWAKRPRPGQPDPPPHFADHRATLRANQYSRSYSCWTPTESCRRSGRLAKLSCERCPRHPPSATMSIRSFGNLVASRSSRLSTWSFSGCKSRLALPSRPSNFVCSDEIYSSISAIFCLRLSVPSRCAFLRIVSIDAYTLCSTVRLSCRLASCSSFSFRIRLARTVRISCNCLARSSSTCRSSIDDLCFASSATITSYSGIV